MRLLKILLALPFILIITSCSIKKTDVTEEQWKNIFDKNNPNSIFSPDYAYNKGLKRVKKYHNDFIWLLAEPDSPKSHSNDIVETTMIYKNTYFRNQTCYDDMGKNEQNFYNYLTKENDSYKALWLSSLKSDAKKDNQGNPNYRKFKLGKTLLYEFDDYPYDYDDLITENTYSSAINTLYNWNNYEYVDGVYKQKDVESYVEGTFNMYYDNVEIYFVNNKLKKIKADFRRYDDWYNCFGSTEINYYYNYKCKQIKEIK